MRQIEAERRSDTGAAPAEYRAPIDGILADRHLPGLAQSGVCLIVVAVPQL
ncbi:MAG: hypothetical protein IH786_10400 [Proteobacteria bacterium]|nr:hypothetical protein [Pseudomonadota bacterium]